MGKPVRTKRIWLATGLLVAGILLMHGLRHRDPVIPDTPLSSFPTKVGQWTGQTAPIPSRILAAAGLSEYVNRVYTKPGSNWVQLFVSYYRTQQTGDTIHSPKHCLPGAGWEPLTSRHLTFAVPGHRRLVVNEYVVARDIRRLLVLYWYREQGRDVASDYSAKFWLSYDALVHKRTDGGFIRVMTPLKPNLAAAVRRAVDFTRLIDPRLPRYMPN